MKKRFVEIDDGLDFSIKHIESGEIFYDCESVVDILNELNDENEQLKKQKEWCRNKLNTILTKTNELHEENEQLKQQVEELEFELRTIKAFDRTVKEVHSDTVYDFIKRLEKW